MGEKSFSPPAGGNTPGTRTYHFSFTLGSSGAVASSDIPNGVVTVVKNAAAGRYNCTIHRAFGRIQNVVVSVEGPASAAFGNTNANAAGLRNVSASAGTFDIQLFLASSGADTDGASGYVVRVTLTVTDWKGL